MICPLIVVCVEVFFFCWYAITGNDQVALTATWVLAMTAVYLCWTILSLPGEEDPYEPPEYVSGGKESEGDE